MCVHSRAVAESDLVPEHERAAADPASVETCPYFDAYAEGGEDVTLPCRILDLVGEGGGWCLYFLAWRAEMCQYLLFQHHHVPGRRRLHLPQQAV